MASPSPSSSPSGCGLLSSPLFCNDWPPLLSTYALQRFLTSLRIEDVLQSQRSFSPMSAFITDLLCTELLDVTAKLKMPSYLFVPSSAALVCFMLHLPKLVSEMNVSFRDANFEVEIPGLPPIPARDLPIQDSSDSLCNWVAHHSSRFKEASGVLINTFAELEEEAMKTLSTPETPSIYPIGVSSSEQITDLAFGLEATGHRFLWVLRGHKSGDSSSLETDISQLLPEGFQSRTGDRGLVVLNWAPQVAVLSHPSTGGFLSHCGWNSTLESISHGVPMIAWPLYAEQGMSKVILVKQIKVAIDLKMDKKGFVKREEVERAVRELMEGEEGRKAREKMKELKGKAKIAMTEGGSTIKATARAAAHMSAST
ncbi:hypothetical protein SUGI_1000510 [Cryptomeria japonica]|nr:hypothetical protein SUGI_1000510 [Cryptomeria japonica]